MRQKNIFIGIIVLLGLPTMVTAKVGGPCVNCHTMHNSQDGFAMAFELDLTLTQEDKTKADTTPNSALLKTDCIGCHQGTNDGNNGPYVLDISATLDSYGTTGTDGDTLAGGNFYWVSTGVLDRTGHNVAGIAFKDGNHDVIPPGSTGTYSEQLTCAGTNGCHGSTGQTNQTLAIWGGHHNNNNITSLSDVPTSTATSYRFLDGVRGLEDPSYEYQPSSTAHNTYYGVDRTSEGTDSTGTISSHCGRCHNDFHNTAGEVSPDPTFTNVWLRHPTDFDMSNATSQGAFDGSEYDYYNDTQNIDPRPYSVISPVARSVETNVATVNFTGTDAIVMCLSCHRAHGSPFAGILRWDYKNWPGTGVNGCAKCHTTKN